MDLLSLVLAPQVVAGVAFAGAALVAVRAALHYARSADELQSMLARIDKTLNARREELPAKRERVAEVGRVLPPMKQQHQRLLDYYNRLRESEADEERNALQQELAEGAERKRRRRQG